MPQHHNQTSTTALRLFNVLLFVGAVLIVFGIGFFIANNWSTINNFTRIFVTLGSAIAALMIASILQHASRAAIASNAFYFIAGMLLPLGLFITFDIYHLFIGIELRLVVISLISLGVFLFYYLFQRQTIFLFFSIIFATTLYFHTLDLILYHSAFVYNDIADYAVMLLGISFVFLGRALALAKQPALVGFLYCLGALLTLGGSYFLGGFYFFDPAFTSWKLLTAVFIMLSFLLAPIFNSQSFLYVGGLFLLIYILDLSTKFVDVFGKFGWPLMLVITGLALMLIGYLFYIIKLYMHTRSR